MNHQALRNRRSVKRPGLPLAVLFLALLVPGVSAGAVTFTIPASPAYQLVANPLANGNTVADVFASLPFGEIDGDLVMKPIGCPISLNGFFPTGWEIITADSSSSTGWKDAFDVNEVPPFSVAPGEGFIFFNANAAAVTVTVSGTTSGGPSTLSCGCGNYSLVSSKAAVPATYDMIVGSPPVEGSRLRKNVFFGVEYKYSCGGWFSRSYPASAWTPSALPTVAVGESVLIMVPCGILAPNDLVVWIEGPALTAPDNKVRSYFVNVDNFSSSSTLPVTLQLDGIPNSPDITLTPPAFSTPVSGVSQGFTVDVPALACGGGASYHFYYTTGGTIPVPGSFTMKAAFLSTYSLTDAHTVNVVASCDPNDKSGPTGIGPHHYLMGNPGLPYAITFENLSSATAPAQRVVITDQLDLAGVNPASFQLGAITFGSKVVTPPFGVDAYSVTVPYDVDGNPLTTADNINVQIDAVLDSSFFSATYGKVTWTFQSLDPLTGLPPGSLLIGFLPPNTTPPQGQGMVTFTVDSVSTMATGDFTTNSASIVFDANAPINAGIWTNTIIKLTPPLTIEPAAAGQVKITWPTWILEEASSLAGPWTNSLVQASPWTFTPSESAKFYRLRAP